MVNKAVFTGLINEKYKGLTVFCCKWLLIKSWKVLLNLGNL